MTAGTIVVGAVLLALVAAAVIKLLRDRRRGKSSCGCGGACAGCPMQGSCEARPNEK